MHRWLLVLALAGCASDPGDPSDLAMCALGTGCAFDGGNHTPPYYAFSALVIAYR